MERCRLRRDLLTLLKASAETRVTAIARKILGTPYVHARMITPDVLEVLPCAKVSLEQLRVRPVEDCFSLTPVWFTDTNHVAVEAFFDPVSFTVRHDSPRIPCEGAKARLPLANSSWIEFEQPLMDVVQRLPQPTQTLQEALVHTSVALDLSMNIFRADDLANWTVPTPLIHFEATLSHHVPSGLTRPLPGLPQIVSSYLQFPEWIVDYWIKACCVVVSLQCVIFFYILMTYIRDLIRPPAPFRNRGQPRRTEEEKVTDWPPPIVAAAGAPYAQVPVTINGVPLCALLDTGASVSIMSSALAPALGIRVNAKNSRSATSASGHSLRLFDDQLVTLQIADTTQPIRMTFSDNDQFLNASYDVILGCSGLAELPPLLFDMANRMVTVGNKKLALMSPEQMIMQPVRIHAVQTYMIPPRTTAIIKCRADPAVSLEDLILLVGETGAKLDAQGMMIQPGIAPLKGEFKVPISNPSEAPQKIFEKMTVAWGQPTKIKEDNSEIIALVETPQEHLQPDPKYQVNYDHLQLCGADKRSLKELVNQFQDIFATHQYDLGLARVPPMEIHTTSDKPVFTRPHRVPFQYRHEFEAHMDKLLRSGAMEPSDTPWVSAIVLVKKKDGSLRPCIDFRALNAITVPDRFPMPRIDDIWPLATGSCRYPKMQADARVVRARLAFTYRFTPRLTELLSQAIYDGRLQHAGSRTQCAAFHQTFNTDEPVVFRDIKGSVVKDHKASLSNPVQEAEIIRVLDQMARGMSQIRDGASDIAVLVPYSASRAALRNPIRQFRQKYPQARVSLMTFDQAQGKESDFGIIATIKNDGNGFMRNQSRVIVALTRFRYAHILITDIASVIQTPTTSPMHALYQLTHPRPQSPNLEPEF